MRLIEHWTEILPTNLVNPTILNNLSKILVVGNFSFLSSRKVFFLSICFYLFEWMKEKIIGRKAKIFSPKVSLFLFSLNMYWITFEIKKNSFFRLQWTKRFHFASASMSHIRYLWGILALKRERKRGRGNEWKKFWQNLSVLVEFIYICVLLFCPFPSIPNLKSLWVVNMTRKEIKSNQINWLHRHYAQWNPNDLSNANFSIFNERNGHFVDSKKTEQMDEWRVGKEWNKYEWNENSLENFNKGKRRKRAEQL